MPFSPILDAVAMELLIEGSRKKIYSKITGGGYKLRDNDLFNGTPSQFFVQNISLSNDGGLDFQVVYNNHDIHYYAFRHKKFIFCPAFLHEFFSLSDYSCLAVTGFFTYYYISIKSRPDDLFSMILSNNSLIRMFNFSPLTTANKYLTLDSKNQDTVYLFSKKLVNKCSSLFAIECGRYIAKRGQVPLFASEHKPEYLFVRRDIKNHLRSRYGKLFKDFDELETAIIHNESATANLIEEINRISNIDKALFESSSLKAYETTNYLCEDHILMKLIEHISKNHEQGRIHKVKDYFSSMFSILQSSGYGKSKLVERLGANTLTFYTSLQQGSGSPKGSFLLLKLIEKLDSIVRKRRINEECFMNNISTAVYIYILRMIFLILTKKKNESQIKPYQSLNIDKELIDASFLPIISKFNKVEQDIKVFEILFKNLEGICCLKESFIFDGFITKTLDNLEQGTSKRSSKLGDQTIKYLKEFSVEGISSENLEEDVMNLLREFKPDPKLPSVFIIDEALGLVYKSLETPKIHYVWSLRDRKFRIETTPYKVFQRIFRMFTNNWNHIMLITVGTFEHLSVQLPNLRRDPSARPRLIGKEIENFSLIQTYNVNSELFQDVKADMFDTEKGKKYYSEGEPPIKDWNEFLVSKFRKIEYFKFGRPLTYRLFKEGEKCYKQPL
jgi:hypothetical protein